MKRILFVLVILGLLIFGVNSVMAQGNAECPNYQSDLCDGTGKNCQNYEGCECFCGTADCQRSYKNMMKKGQGCIESGKGINCRNKQQCTYFVCKPQIPYDALFRCLLILANIFLFELFYVAFKSLLKYIILFLRIIIYDNLGN